MKKALLVSIIILVLVILGGALFYFTQINNIFVVKENLEKPTVDVTLLTSNPGTQVIFENHVEYLANEIGSYKLHSYNGEPAIIVFDITDINKKMVLTVDDDIKISEQVPETYDLSIKGDQLTIAGIINSDNLKGEIVNKANEGKITIEVVSDTTTLAMKGFLSVYEEISG